MTRPVRVLIADDHPVALDGLRGMFEGRDGFEVVGEARDGMEALALLARVRANVVLMDLRMPRRNGPAATARIAAEHPDVRVLALTTYDADADIVRAIEGARGGSVLAPAVAARVMRHLRPGRDESALSAREVEVLELVRRGATNREIAAALHIGEATVKTHLLHAYAKLGVSDRTALSYAAARVRSWAMRTVTSSVSCSTWRQVKRTTV